MRKALKKEATQYINPLLTAAKMREWTHTKYRHTILRPIRPESNLHLRQNYAERIRQNAADYFFIFCRQVIPKIEERVEVQLLEKFKKTLATQLEKDEVDLAYQQRKENVAKIPELEDPGEPEPKKKQIRIPADQYFKVIQSIHGDGLAYHTYSDIGRYTVFPENMAKRMLPNVMFGRYKKDEYDLNKTLGIQTREEGLRIANDLARLTLPKERSIDYTKIAIMSNA